MVVINMTCPYKVQMLNAKGYIYIYIYIFFFYYFFF